MAETTAYRRWSDPTFRRQVSELRAAVVAAALGQLTEVMCKAVTTLEGLLDAESEMVRLGASRAILEHSAKIRESVELEDRITQLEQHY